MITEIWVHPEDDAVQVAFDPVQHHWLVLVLSEMIDYSYRWIKRNSFSDFNSAVTWALDPQNVE